MTTESTLRKADGPIVSFAETGSADGVPVFYFHGTPGSRNDFDLPYNRSAL
jgi:hypothetical protein